MIRSSLFTQRSWKPVTMIFRMQTLAYTLTAALLLAACTDIRLAGPSTEQGNPQIVATVVDNSKHPVEGALITIYIVPQNSDSDQAPQSAIVAVELHADASGTGRFENLPPGKYSIGAFDSASNRSAIVSNITLAGLKPATPVFSDTIVLVAPGGIKGVVSRGGVAGNVTNQNLRDGFIQVKIGEIDRSTVTGPDGKYTFENLPSGAYTVYFYATDGFYSSRMENVAVASGAVSIADTVVLKPVPRLLPPKSLGAFYDSAGGIVRLSWRKVAIDSLRWYEVERVNITAIHDTVFITSDTLWSDTVAGMPSGTVLDYVVRTVDKAFNRSENAGPVEIRVR